MSKKWAVVVLTITLLVAGCSTTQGISKANSNKSTSSLTDRNVAPGGDFLLAALGASIFLAVAISNSDE